MNRKNKIKKVLLTILEFVCFIVLLLSFYALGFKHCQEYVEDNCNISLKKEVNRSFDNVALPDSGYIDKIYFNDSMSNNEILNLAQSLNYISLLSFGFDGYDGCFFYVNEDATFALCFVYNIDFDSYYISKVENLSIVTDLWSYDLGFLYDFENPISINADNYLYSYASIFNQIVQNDLMSNFISINPFSSPLNYVLSIFTNSIDEIRALFVWNISQLDNIFVNFNGSLSSFSIIYFVFCGALIATCITKFVVNKILSLECEKNE